jgi:ribosomal protein S18 acetylase RimI-like enzyme
MTLTMVPVELEDETDFFEMAKRHFSDLNPEFVPARDWQSSYLKKIRGNRDCCLRWIVIGDERAGFILTGIEEHRFLPRKTGVIYELYIDPKFRRRGLARRCASEAIRELWSMGPSKIQLEVTAGNVAATELWASLGFKKVSERMVLTKN